MAQTHQYQIIKPEQVQTGMQIRVHQRITEQTAKGMKERIQVFEGLVMTVRGKDAQKTMTVRKVSNGVGVEKIFPLALPTIDKVELVKQYKVRRKNIDFLKRVKKRLKETAVKLHAIKEETPVVEAPVETQSEVGSEESEVKEEAPVEEKKEEAPVAEEKTEATPAEEPKEEEEKKEEAPAEEPKTEEKPAE